MYMYMYMYIHVYTKYVCINNYIYIMMKNINRQLNVEELYFNKHNKRTVCTCTCMYMYMN